MNENGPLREWHYLKGLRGVALGEVCHWGYALRLLTLRPGRVTLSFCHLWTDSSIELSATASAPHLLSAAVLPADNDVLNTLNCKPAPTLIVAVLIVFLHSNRALIKTRWKAHS